MKALSLHGPWAVFEKRNADNEAMINSLQVQVLHHQQEALADKALIASLQAQIESQLPVHKDEAYKARALVGQLESEVKKTQLERDQALADVQHLEHTLSVTSAELTSVRAELALVSDVRTSTSKKLDEIRRKLGLTDAEGHHFIKELDTAVTSNKALHLEVAELTQARNSLQQQCERRSQHCMTLIAEGKRNAEQMSELRRQVLDLQHSEWQLKQQLAAMKKQHERKAPIVHKERPGWQDITSGAKHAVVSRSVVGASTPTTGRRASCEDLARGHSRSQVVREVLADTRNRLKCTSVTKETG